MLGGDTERGAKFVQENASAGEGEGEGGRGTGERVDWKSTGR